MTRPAPAETVLSYLTTGRRTLAEAERLTGWPVRAIRRLVARQPNLLVGADGRVVVPPDTVELAEVEAREEVRVLYAEVEERMRLLGFSWREVIGQMHTSFGSIYRLRDGTAGENACAKARRWLAAMDGFQPAVTDPRELYALVVARKERLRLTWSQIAVATDTNVSTLNNLGRGLMSERTRVRVQAWLVSACTEGAARDAG